MNSDQTAYLHSSLIGVHIVGGGGGGIRIKSVKGNLSLSMLIVIFADK